MAKKTDTEPQGSATHGAQGAPANLAATPEPPAPDVLSHPILRALLTELRKMGPKRVAKHDLEISQGLVDHIRSQMPGVKSDGDREAKLFGVKFVVDGNDSGLSYKLTKRA